MFSWRLDSKLRGVLLSLYISTFKSSHGIHFVISGNDWFPGWLTYDCWSRMAMNIPSTQIGILNVEFLMFTFIWPCVGIVWRIFLLCMEKLLKSFWLKTYYKQQSNFWESWTIQTAQWFGSFFKDKELTVSEISIFVHDRLYHEFLWRSVLKTWATCNTIVFKCKDPYYIIYALFGKLHLWSNVSQDPVQAYASLHMPPFLSIKRHNYKILNCF